MRWTLKCSQMDCRRKWYILKELKRQPGSDKISKYKHNLIQHVERMQRDRLSKLLKNYKPQGLRNQGWPKRDFWKVEAGTDQQWQNFWMLDDDDDDDDDDDIVRITTVIRN